MSSTPKYRTQFAWNSPYGHVVQLFDELSIRPGIVLDLGCGIGPVAEPLSERGFKYVGLDLDKHALNELRTRGYQCYEKDLALHEELPEALPQLVGGERVAAVLLLDVLEHIPGTRAFLDSLQEALFNLDRPILILSLPNVGHADVGAKLAFGRFDYMATGLLDETHVTFFTHKRMLTELRRLGWVEIGQNDFSMYESDQHFPSDHPALCSRAPLARLISHWREMADDFSRTNQFVRAFALERVGGEPITETVPTAFLCVLMRTTGRRNENLREALTCLAAQTVDDFGVNLIVHGDSDLVKGVRAIVEEFHPTFSSRVRVISVRGGGRGRPLNVGLDHAHAKYVGFLDDDDLVTGDWVEAFQTASQQASGQVLRSITVNQYVERIPQPAERSISYVPRSSLQNTFEPSFDLATHLHTNQTPICSFAVPKATVDALNLRFDESLPVTEDWEFLLKVAQIAGVYDTGKITSVYRRWLCGEGSDGEVDRQVWDRVRNSILDRLDQAPLLMPKGSVRRLVGLKEESVELENSRREIAKTTAELEGTRQVLEAATRDRDAALHEAAGAKGLVDAMEHSLSWRVTFPVRWTLHYARRLTGRGRRPAALEPFQDEPASGE